MNKTESLLWGVLCSLLGGLIVAGLIYYLVLRRKNINLAYFLLGFFLVVLLLFLVLGSWLFLGIFSGVVA